MGAGFERPLQGLCQRSPAALWVLPDRLPGATYTLVQQHRERLGVGMLHLALLIDHEVREERLVEEPSHLRRSCQVRRLAVPGQVERRSQVRFDLLGLGHGRIEPFLHSRQSAPEPLLFGSDELHRHGAAVDRLDQLLPLCGELELLTLQQTTLSLGVLATRGERLTYAFLQRIAQP
ncbi:hypothetical protein [Streptomyces sp. PR69]|uniref:hypothetical protein n=1 Tax=Streptomyces sp. PR69 TaxID=2984950 RepID=UPI00226454AF|nr:hypothetical protein [Streptomyces sp. PR69]